MLNSGRFWQQFLADDIKIVAFVCLFLERGKISGLGQVLSNVKAAITYFFGMLRER